VAHSAKEAGLAAVALTDHDTLAGCEEFLTAAREEGIEAIPGVELSCEVPGRTCHMLGYFLEEDSAPLRETLEDLRRHREGRNERIIESLQGLGMKISLEDVQEFSEGGVIGRNHIAQCLVSKGVVSSTQEAFDRYLARGKPAYVERKRLTPEEACHQILASGGLPVLAHPAQLRFEIGELRDFVGTLVEEDLCGMEVFYPNRSPSRVAEEMQIAESFGLEVTAGSDYHGAGKPHIVLGGTGCPWVEQIAMVERLHARRKTIQSTRSNL
jgi:predicted metal-dependent phosphoesterase TrpH